MVEKKIKALEDFQFTNFTGTHFLVAGEVKRIKFMNQQRFEQHLLSGRMVEADLHEKEDKTIPVILPPVSEETIVLVEPVDPIDPLEESPGEELDIVGDVRESPAEVPRDLPVEFEEIPIEEQDESKPGRASYFDQE